MRYLIVFTSLVLMVNNSNAEPAEHGREADKSHSREYGQFRPVQRVISDYRKDHRSDNKSDHRRDHRRDRRRDHRSDHRKDHRRDHRHGHREDHRRDVWIDSLTGTLGWSSHIEQNFRTTIHRPDHQRHHRNDHSSVKWIAAGDFRSRRSHDSDPIIEVNDKVNHLGLEGTKRSVYVERAYIEFGNGQIKRIRSLEGIIHNGEQHRHQLARTRQVSRVYLHLSPLGDRGYARLTYAH